MQNVIGIFILAFDSTRLQRLVAVRDENGHSSLCLRKNEVIAHFYVAQRAFIGAWARLALCRRRIMLRRGRRRAAARTRIFFAAVA